MPGRVKIETIGKSDEDRELIVVWISSDENIRTLTKNRDNLARIADPRRSSPAEIRQLIATTKPQYHLMGGLQRRDRSVRNADGAGLPPGDGDLSAHQSDSRQRLRVRYAGRRPRRARPQCRLVLSQS